MKKSETPPLGITIVSLLMIVFGLAEIVTGFSHNFFGISTAPDTISAYAAATIGLLYAVGGALILTMKKWAASLAIMCLSIVIIGRVLMVLTGLYPFNSFLQIIAIIIGTAIAAIFAIYIGFKWTLFR